MALLTRNLMQQMSNIDYVGPENPHLNLAALISATIERQDWEEYIDGFTLSPLTSPEATPPSTPTLSPTNLPEPDVKTIPHPPSTPIPTPSRSQRVSPPEPSTSTNKRQKKNPARALPPHRRERRNAAGNAARAKQRGHNEKPKEAQHEARHQAYERYVESSARLEFRLDMNKINVAEGAHIAFDDGSGDQKTYTLEDLIGEKAKHKMRLQKWDGEQTMALLDNKKRVIGVLAGHPDDPDWPILQQQAADALESRRSRCSISKKDKKKALRRGKFVSLNCGISHGGGQSRPSNRWNKSPNQQVIDELTNLEPFRRISGFSNSVMATWMPGLYEYYRAMGDAIFEHDPTLIRIFPSSVFPGATYNFGPKTLCHKHKDYGNLSFGVCPVTSLGSYDYTKGGHLILWDLDLVVEFPPGSTILIPSSVIAHSNVAIGPEETRYSFTQYSAGGLFRWVESGFQPRLAYLASLSDEEKAVDTIRQNGRLAFGLSLLPTLS